MISSICPVFGPAIPGVDFSLPHMNRNPTHPLFRPWIALIATGLCLLAGAPALQARGPWDPIYAKTGHPELVYHATAAQAARLFPVGTPRAAIHAKFGPPAADSGSTAERDCYNFGISYEKMDRSKKSVGLTRVVAVSLTYDAGGKVAEVSYSVFASFVRTHRGTVTESREPTEGEVAQYLAPVNPTLVEPVIAAGYGVRENRPALAAQRWHLGIELETGFGKTIWGQETDRIMTYVVGLEADSIGARAGIEVGDVVVAINGRKTENASDVVIEIGNADPTRAIEVKIRRRGGSRTIVIPPKSG